MGKGPLCAHKRPQAFAWHSKGRSLPPGLLGLWPQTPGERSRETWWIGSEQKLPFARFTHLGEADPRSPGRTDVSQYQAGQCHDRTQYEQGQAGKFPEREHTGLLHAGLYSHPVDSQGRIPRQPQSIDYRSQTSIERLD